MSSSPNPFRKPAVDDESSRSPAIDYVVPAEHGIGRWILGAVIAAGILGAIAIAAMAAFHTLIGPDPHAGELGHVCRDGHACDGERSCIDIAGNGPICTYSCASRESICPSPLACETRTVLYGRLEGRLERVCVTAARERR